MKKNRLMRIAALLLVLTLATSCFVGGTFAKYTSTATVTDTAKVAKWDVLLGTEQIANASTTVVTINLFETANYDEDTTTTDADVADGKLIAPGTGGSFALTLTNKSEVNAQYTMSLASVEIGDIPIQYSLDKSVWVDDITALNTNDALVEEALAMGATDQTTATIYWRWVFGTGSTDAADTLLGIAARDPSTVPQVTVTATITVEQVD